MPFEIPDSWEWCKIGTIFSLQAGKNISANQINEYQSDESFPCFGGNGIRGYVSSYNRDGDYPIIGRQGALCGNINLAKGKFYATEHAVCVETFASTNVLWCCYFLTALNLNQYATATAQPGLAVANINDVFIPTPIYSRFSKVIIFEPISVDDKIKIARKCYFSLFNSIDIDDKILIENNTVLSFFEDAIRQGLYPNMRMLRNDIEDAINYEILKARDIIH